MIVTRKALRRVTEKSSASEGNRSLATDENDNEVVAAKMNRRRARIGIALERKFHHHYPEGIELLTQTGFLDQWDREW